MAGDGRRSRRRRAWIAACAISAALHGAVLFILVQRAVQPAPEMPPTIEVSLIRPADPEPEATDAPTREQPTLTPDRLTRERASQQVRTAPLIAPMQATPAPLTVPASPPAGAPGDAPAGGARPAGSPPRPTPRPPLPGGDDGERVRSLLRSAGCESGSARLTPAERARCQERFGGSRPTDPIAPPKDWAARRRRDEARRASRKSLFDDNDSQGPRASDSVLIGGGGGVGLGVSVPFGQPPKALPNIPAHTLRGDDDALRPKTKPPAEKPPGD